MGEKLLNVDAAAEGLSVKPSTVRMWILKRKIGHVRIGRCVRIPAVEIERIIREGAVPARVSR